MSIRTDLAVIVAIIGITMDVASAFALVLAVVAHELGHFAVARALGGQGNVLLQVGSGRAYLKGIEGTGPTVAVLLAGGLAALLPFTASLYLEYFGAKLRSAVVLWTLYQMLPYPSLDGGQLLECTLLRRVNRKLVRWRILWVVGGATVLVLGWQFAVLGRPLLYFTAMAILLARGEAGALRYADAYEAWDAGAHDAVIRRAYRAPRYLSDDESEALTLLGLASARHLDDSDAIEGLADGLPAYHPERVRAAEYLLRSGHEGGEAMARTAFEAFDQGRVSRSELDEELWADLAFHYASAEAGGGRTDVALTLLERAESFGFDQVERLEADPQLGSLESQPRFRAVVDRMQARGDAPVA